MIIRNSEDDIEGAFQRLGILVKLFAGRKLQIMGERNEGLWQEYVFICMMVEEHGYNPWIDMLLSYQGS